MGWMFYRMGDGGGHTFAGLLLVVVLLVAIVLLVVWVSRTLHGHSHGPLHGTAAPAPGPTQSSPREILDRRLAAGELTAEQYDVIRAKLDGG
jgi:putative membrane protein